MANLAVARWGQTAVIPVAFLCIGLDLTSRDHLHEAWKHKNLIWKMGLLILTGSVITLILNRNAGSIAVASLLAFTSAAIVDTIIYQVLDKKPSFFKINGSNIFSSMTDSTIFLTVAFGAFMPALILKQFLAKFLGGMVWFFILEMLSENKKETGKWYERLWKSA